MTIGTPRVKITTEDESAQFKKLKTTATSPANPSGEDYYYGGGGIGQIGLSSIFVHSAVLPTDLDGGGNVAWLNMLKDGLTGDVLTPVSFTAQAPYMNTNGDVGYIYEFVFKDIPDGLSTTNCVTSLAYSGPGNTLFWIGGTAPSMSSFFVEKQATIANYAVEPTLNKWLVANDQTPMTEYSFAFSNPNSDLTDAIIIDIAANAALHSTLGGSINFFNNANSRTAASDTAVSELISLSWGLNNV